MNILYFIELALKSERMRMSPSAVDKTEDCVKALAAYLDNKELDIRDALFFDFLYGFGEFLTKGYERSYSPATAAECLRTLRKHLRTAVSLGLIPNIDNVPAVIDALERDVWGSAPKVKSRSVKPLNIEVGNHIGVLMRALDAWNVKRKMGVGKVNDRNEREIALQARCAAVYLFCVMNYGIDIKDALSIKKSDGSNDFFVEKYGVKLPVAQGSALLAEIYNGKANPGEHLFSALDNSKYKGDADKAATLIENRAIKYLRRSGLPLFTQQCAAIDWIDLAIDNGLNLAVAEKLWSLHRGKTTIADAMYAIQVAQRLCFDGKDGVSERWYLLSLTTPSVKRPRFLKMLVSSGIMGTPDESSKRIYAPEERRREKDGDNAVLSRYVFFRATEAQARFADSFSPYARVFKNRGSDGFARVNEQEIESLQIMLRDFPDGVELVDGKDWLAKHNAEIVPGRKAVIRSGSLAGKEATVVRIKGSSTAEPTYLLEFVEGIIKFRTDLAGVDLEIVCE